MFDDPEIEPFLRRLAAEFVERNVDLVSTLQALRLSLVGRAHAEDENAPPVKAAIAVLGTGPRDHSSDRAEAVFLAETGAPGLPLRLQGTLDMYAFLYGRVRRHAAGEATVTSVELDDGRGVLCAWGVHGGLFVAGTSVRAVRGALVRAQSAADDCLERDESFTKTVARLSAGQAGAGLGAAHDYLVYVNAERALRGTSADLAARWGLEGLRSVALVGRIGEGEDASFRETFYLYAPGERGFLLETPRGASLTLATARLVPPRALIALFGPVNAGAGGRLSALLPGLDPVARCAEALGGEEGGTACAFLWSVGRINWLPRVGCVGPAQREKFARAWADLARSLGGRLVKHKFGGTPEPVVIHSIETMRPRLPFVRSLAACVRGRRLFMATDTAAVRELLLTEQGGLAETEGMKRLVAELPERKCLFVYVDIPRIVERAFEPYAPAVIEALLPGASERLEREAMPSGARVARHLRPAAVSVLAGAEGLRIDAVTPAGLIPTAATAALVLDAVLSAR